VKIGVSSYSYYQYIKDGRMTVKDAVKKAAEMGFDAIEFIELPSDGMSQEELARELVSEAASCGIEISAYLIGAQLLKETEEESEAEIARIKKQIDIANILGVKLFRYDILFSLPPFVTYKQALKKVAPAMREIAEYAKKYGITTMSENHGYIFQDADRMIEVVTEVNHENYKLLVDMGNFMCADEIPHISVGKVASLAAHVHVKDFEKYSYEEGKNKENVFKTRGCNFLIGTTPGKGDVNVEQCLEILKGAGFDGYIDLEYEGPRDCIEALAEGLETLRKII